MDDVEAIAALQEPLRRRLYDYVVGHGREVGRAEAAAAAGVGRTLAAFHLDRLVEAGLLETVYRRPEGRGGPGAGRPAKLYRRAPGERTVSLPPRSYDLAAGVLADAAERAGIDAEVRAAAVERGRAIGRASGGGTLREALERQGYEPYEDAGGLRLRNCPFHRLAQDLPPLACGMNLALCEGLLDGLGAAGWTARLDPRTSDCCVAFSKNNSD